MHLPSSVIRTISEPLQDIFDNSDRLRCFSRLNRSQWLRGETLLEIQNERLAAVCRHAGTHVPYYRDTWRELGLATNEAISTDNLPLLPILKKDVVRENLQDLLSESFDFDQLIVAKTGGSTGVPLIVYCENRAAQHRAAARIRADEWSGWRFGEPMAAVWGNPTGPASWKARIRRSLRAPVICLDTMSFNGESVAAFMKDWESLKPGLLYGHAHSIYMLALEIENSPPAHIPNGIVTTSMMLLENERHLIKKVFRSEVTNRYGCEEVGLIACECEAHSGFHLHSEGVIVEVLDDSGSACPPGVEGRLVVTDLLNHGMPLVRYEVGDRGALASGPCKCGRGLAMLDRITGRVADFLKGRDGTRVAGISLIEQTLTKFPGLKQMQMIQTEERKIQVRMVCDTGDESLLRQQLFQELQEAMGGGFEIHFERVDSIAPEKNGKFRFTKCLIENQ